MMKRLSISISVVIGMILWVSLTGNTHAQTTPIPVQCGTIIEGEVTELGNQEQDYSINLAPGDTIQTTAEAVGDYLALNLGVFSPSEHNLNSNPDWHIGDHYVSPTKSLDTGVLSERGIYTLKVLGDRLGLYILRVGCTLRDGTLIEPGQTSGGTPDGVTSPLTFSGYGFAGLDPVSFVDITEIPITLGEVYSEVVTGRGSEISLYTYQAQANIAVKLSVRKISGDLSIGVAIVRQADGELVLITGMPFAENFTSEIVFPTQDIYTIGVFRLDFPPNQVGSSGAFEIQLR